MAGLTRADYVDMLEELYVLPGRMFEMVFRDNPALGMLEKTKFKAGRRYVHVPITWARPQGRSANFANAQGNATPSEIDAFQVTYVSNYGVGTVDGDVIDDAAENVELIAEALEHEVDGAIENMRDDLALGVFNNRGGARGVISAGSTVGSGTISLDDPEDIVHFEVGMELVASDDDGSDSADALRSAGASLTITAVNRDLGTLTSDADWDAQIAAIAVGDFLFVEGDFQGKMSGLDSWDPETAPDSTLFFGVDRSVDSRLGGLRFDGSSLPIEQAIMRGAARARRWKAPLDTAFLNPLAWDDLAVSIESSSTRPRSVSMVTVNGTGDAAQFSWDAIRLVSSAGGINILPDPNCQPDICWLYSSNHVFLGYSGKEFVRIIDDDGQPFLREVSNDGVEFRVKNRGNMCVKAPGYIQRVTIATT